MPSRDPIILTPDEVVVGEPEWAIRQAEMAGIIYHCEQGEDCPLGWHKGSGFWHLCEGRTMQNYDAVTDSPDNR